jgi:plasmid stabilization system protein ParE
VTAADQAQLTAEAHRRWAAEQRRRWGEAAQTIHRALSDFADGGVDRRLENDLRTIERGVGRVSRRLDDERRRAEGV